MSENGTVAAAAEETNQATAAETTNNETARGNAENAQDVSYSVVEKDGEVTAIWEMQGRKHLRTIDPRSSEGKQILALFETAA